MPLPPRLQKKPIFGTLHLLKTKPTERRVRMRMTPVVVHESIGYPGKTERIAAHVLYLRRYTAYGEEIRELIKVYFEPIFVQEMRYGEEGKAYFLSYLEQMDAVITLMSEHEKEMAKYYHDEATVLPKNLRKVHEEFWLPFRFEELYPMHEGMYMPAKQMLNKNFSPDFNWVGIKSRREELEASIAHLRQLRENFLITMKEKQRKLYEEKAEEMRAWRVQYLLNNQGMSNADFGAVGDSRPRSRILGVGTPNLWTNNVHPTMVAPSLAWPTTPAISEGVSRNTPSSESA